MPTTAHADQAKKKPAKQFVAHGRHNRSLSSTRLAQNASRQRLVPLTGADEAAAMSPSEYEDPRAKMKRSKSTDAISRKDKRLAPLKTTKSHTRLHRPSAAMPNAVKATGRGAVMQLGGGSDTEDDEDHGEDSPKESLSSNQHAASDNEMDESDLTPPQRPTVSKSSSQDSLPPTYKPKAAPPKINDEIVFATTQEKNNPFYGDSIGVKGPGKALRPSLDRTVSASHTTRTQQKLWLQRESMDQQRPATHITPEQRKEFERISKEYLSVCRYYSPIADCIRRNKEDRRNEAPRKIKDRRDDLATGLSQSLPKRVNSLSATMLSSQGSPNTWHAPPGAEQSVDNITQLLNKLWSEPYNNPEDPRQVQDTQPSIGLQAQRAQQNMTAGRTARGPNGGLRLG